MINFEFLLIFLLHTFLAFFFWKYNYKIAIYLDLFDDVNQQRKLKKTKTPLTGGLVILSFFYLYFFLNKFDLTILQNKSFQIDAVFYLIVVSLLFIVGFYDDKYDLAPNLKLIILVILFSIVIYLDESLLISKLDFKSLDLSLNIKAYSFFFVIFCLIVFSNSTNMFDGINLQCSSYFLFIILYLQIIFVNNLEIYPFLLSLTFGILFFILLNINNKSYLGDSGVYILSFILGVLIIKAYNNGYLYCDQILLMMLIPGIDMTRLTFTRIYNGKHPFKADNEHIHHLMGKKFSELEVFLINYNLIIIPNIFAYIFQQYVFFIIITTIIYILLIIKFNGTNKKI